MRYLGEQGVGHPTPVRPIPIVPAAIVYDLFLGGGAVLPDAAMGYAAAQAAAAQAARGVPVGQGNAGAATGVTVGKWGGFQQMMKGGFGVAGVALDGLEVWAAAVVNAVGDVAQRRRQRARRGAHGGRHWRGWQTKIPTAASRRGRRCGWARIRRWWSSPRTRLLDKTGCNRLAQRGHDGLAHCAAPGAHDA
jgi:L-aminopeptidase/D-esterase-like protein